MIEPEGDGAVYLSFISALSQLYLSCAAALFQLYRGFVSLGRGFIPLLTHR